MAGAARARWSGSRHGAAARTSLIRIDDEATVLGAEVPPPAPEANEGGSEEIAEEIDDFEILAEADADDADLLAADGEAEHTASGVFELPGPPGGTGASGRAPSFMDFANRLERTRDLFGFSEFALERELDVIAHAPGCRRLNEKRRGR